MKASRPVHLLDSNVLIALADGRHVANGKVREWMQAEKPRFASCPTTQGALVRFFARLDNSHGVRVAKQILAGLQQHPRYEFWPDDIPYTELPERGLRGHQQVTTFYLVALAAANGGKLVTLDRALAVGHKDWCVLVP